MISKKTLYGLQAVILLSKRHALGPVLITDLAREGHIPKKFLEAILLELKKGGILNSKKGKGGGYILAKDPQDITVGNIIRILEGSFSKIQIEDQTKEINEIEIIIKEAQDAMSKILGQTSLSDVIERGAAGNSILNYVI